jgi:hypothetical protein
MTISHVERMFIHQIGGSKRTLPGLTNKTNFVYPNHDVRPNPQLKFFVYYTF